MNLIELSLIHVAPTRQRRTFAADKLHELSDGIATRGLLHPIILRQVEDQFILVAGERRLRAITDLSDLGQTFLHDGQSVPPGYIPYTLFSDLDPLAAEEAELEENVHRENLTWQERAAALARLSSLRTRQAVAASAPAPSIADLSLEVRGSSEGTYHETTRRELIVARHLHNPEVKAAKTIDEAFKILRKQEAGEKSRALGESVGRTYSHTQLTALNEDSLAWMQTAADAQFDVILTDPPYGMGADEFGDSGGLAAGAHDYEDSIENALQCYRALAREGFRLAKTQAHLYAFCDIDNFFSLKVLFAEAGWTVFRTPLIWLKRSGARAPWPEWGPQRKYETILYAIKGKRPVLKMVGDVLDHAPDTNLGHAAQKPVALYADLLSRSCLPGQSVFDPFMGTGTIFSAAYPMKLRVVGIEQSQESFGIAVKRVEGLKDQLELGL